MIKIKVAIYCRVSKKEQTLEQQKEPLIDYCKRNNLEYNIFEEKISGAKEHRTELDKLMIGIRERQYNKVLVWKLDRLGRSLKHLIQLIEEFNNKDIQFICLNPNVDTKTSMGRFFIQILGAVAELEREFIRERTIEKLEYMKEQRLKGDTTIKNFGRPKGSKDKKERRKSGYYLRYAKK